MDMKHDNPGWIAADAGPPRLSSVHDEGFVEHHAESIQRHMLLKPSATPHVQPYRERARGDSSTSFEDEQATHPRHEAISNHDEIWKLYQARVLDADRDLIEGWNDSLTMLLVFAGLFSAVATGFVIESSKRLQPDYAQLAVLALTTVLNTSSQKTSSDLMTFTPSTNARWVNAMWFTSLALALVVSLLAILAKQWIGEYSSKVRAPAEHARQWAWRHYAFRYGLERWGVGGLVAALSVLLHISLFLFLAGLVGFIFELDLVIFGILATITGITAAFYLTAVMLPLWFGDCPSATPLLVHLRASALHFGWQLQRWLYMLPTNLYSKSAPILDLSLDRATFHPTSVTSGHHVRRDAEIMGWLIAHLPPGREGDRVLDSVESFGLHHEGASVDAVAADLSFTRLSALTLVMSSNQLPQHSMQLVLSRATDAACRLWRENANTEFPYHALPRDQPVILQALSLWAAVWSSASEAHLSTRDRHLVLRSYEKWLSRDTELPARMSLDIACVQQALLVFSSRTNLLIGHSWMPRALFNAGQFILGALQDPRCRSRGWIQWSAAMATIHGRLVDLFHMAQTGRIELVELAGVIVFWLADRDVNAHYKLAEQFISAASPQKLVQDSPLNMLTRYHDTHVSAWRRSMELPGVDLKWFIGAAHRLVVQLAVLDNWPVLGLSLGADVQLPVLMLYELCGDDRGIRLAMTDPAVFLEIGRHGKVISQEWWNDTRKRLLSFEPSKWKTCRTGRFTSPKMLAAAIDAAGSCVECSRVLLQLEYATDTVASNAPGRQSQSLADAAAATMQLGDLVNQLTMDEP